MKVGDVVKLKDIKNKVGIIISMKPNWGPHIDFLAQVMWNDIHIWYMKDDLEVIHGGPNDC